MDSKSLHERNGYTGKHISPTQQGLISLHSLQRGGKNQTIIWYNKNNMASNGIGHPRHVKMDPGTFKMHDHALLPYIPLHVHLL